MMSSIPSLRRTLCSSVCVGSVVKPEDAVYIGDSEYDMQCAKSAGVKSVLALWGCSEAEKLTSDLRFEHPAEILTLR